VVHKHNRLTFSVVNFNLAHKGSTIMRQRPLLLCGRGVFADRRRHFIGKAGRLKKQ
jgi:hypothetical protein